VPQLYKGVPVRYGRLAATVNNGNLVLLGTETWGDVRGLSTKPKVTAQQALDLGFAYVGGRSVTDETLRDVALEIIPVAPQELQDGGGFAGPVGAGYRHRLVWSYVFRRPPDEATWEILVDAHSGEVLAFQDVNLYVERTVTGGVYPLTNTGICPNNATCGTLQSGWPMPFADTGFASPNNFTNSAGVYSYSSGTATTTLTGRYVDIVDSCGAITNSSTTGSIDLGGSNNQHDCTTGGGSAGNTAASRSAFYEVNKLAEQARGWLTTNTWLNSLLTTNVNLNNTCNAFWSTAAGTINFYRSGGGCRNTGEIAGVFDHEWGHGMDDNDAAGALSSSSEAYADIAAIYRLQTSCVGHGFFQTSDKGCGQTADGTGFNANEAQQGAAHCDLDCSGVRSTTSTCTVTSLNGFNSAVALSCTSLAAGASCSFSSSSVTPPANGSAISTLTLTTSGAAAGTDNFSVRGVSGALARSAGMSLTVQGPPSVFFDDFETNLGWTTNPDGTDTATTGLWERADPKETTLGLGNAQSGEAFSGTFDLVTGPLAGRSVIDHDVDGGVTTIRSPAITLPSTGTLTLSFAYYLAYTNWNSNSTPDDYLRVWVIGTTTSLVFEERGGVEGKGDAVWATTSINISPFAGQTVRIQIEAADAATESLVEAAVDDVLITQQ
jgi:peptidase YpeB-like protein